jgi:error-prone DNA polymerase
MELLFERFLSENRGEWPDIDLDLPSGDQREQVIQYLYERYGALGAAMTANVITIAAARQRARWARRWAFDEDQLARLSSLWATGSGAAKTTHGASFRAGGLRHPSSAHRALSRSVHAHADLPRHLGQHSGGMVICAGMLNRVVPIERASMPGRTVVQWDKEDCADLGSSRWTCWAWA